jgi:hypothetical protein
MRRSPFLWLGFLWVCAMALCAFSTCAQDDSSSESGAVPTATTGQSKVSSTPVSVLSVEQAGAGAPQPAVKKVWTNSDVQDLRADSPISTIGNPNGAPTAARNAHPTDAFKNQKWYADQITRLQAQLPPIDRKIASLQAGVSGQFTGDSQTSTRPAAAYFGDWRLQLAQLQKRRADIDARIDLLRTQARQAGISPNSLP